MKGREEVRGGLEVSGGDAPEVLELIEEPLDAVAFPVEVAIYGSDAAHVGLAGDMGGCARRLDRGDHGLTEVAPVPDHIAGEPEGTDQFRRGGLVGGLPWGEQKSDRQAAAVHDRMDLGRQPSPGQADGVIRAPFFPPAACWWARTMELSIKCKECGDFSAKASKMRSQTPAFAHLL